MLDTVLPYDKNCGTIRKYRSGSVDPAANEENTVLGVLEVTLSVS
jgi:hypothetical protein